MNAGRLRDRVAILSKVSQPNGQGGQTTGWVTIAEAVPAEVRAMTGDEALRLGVERSVAQYLVTVRRRTDLVAECRVKWNGLTLDVRSALPDPRDPRAALRCICEAGLVSDQ